MSPTPTTKHQRISRRLVILIGNELAKINQEEGLYYSPTDVMFDDINVFQPDLFYVGHEEKVKEKYIEGPPLWMGEILSSSTRIVDSVTKKKTYEDNGVEEYWVIDPDVDEITVFELDEGKYL